MCSGHPHWSGLVPFLMTTTQPASHQWHGHLHTPASPKPCQHPNRSLTVTVWGQLFLSQQRNLGTTTCPQPVPASRCPSLYLLFPGVPGRVLGFGEGGPKRASGIITDLPQDCHNQRGTWEEGRAGPRKTLGNVLPPQNTHLPCKAEQCSPAQGGCEADRRCIGHPRAVPCKTCL